MTSLNLKLTIDKNYTYVQSWIYDNSIVSYTTSKTANNHRLYETFNRAIELNPEAKPIFHSERGYQYTSIQFGNMIEKQGMIHSMSRVGKCIDNGPIENLCGIIKREMFNINNFNNTQEIEKAIDDYIEFYNKVRLQSKFKSHSSFKNRNMAI